MIGKLTGIIDSLMKDSLLLDVNGVGYHVFASARTMGRIGGAGDRASLLIHTHVREDMIQLFGFADKVEQDWFNLLTTVQGVGNKAGLSILSACPPERLALVIASQDKAALTQADGVGPKLATRILTELKDKAGDISMAQNNVLITATAVAGPDAKANIADHAPDLGSVANDAVSALVNLGYGRSEAFSAVSGILSNDDGPAASDTGRVIAMALKELAQ
jgi:Holliday junction DNA helicase RuvA